MRASIDKLLFAALIATGPAGAVLVGDAAAGTTCSSIQGDVERLACYDRAFRGTAVAASRATSAPSSTMTAGAVPSERPATAAAVEPVADFGLTQQARRERDGQQAAESLEAKVTGVGRTTTDKQVVTLDNGQVWAQTEAYVGLRVKTGSTVQIRRAAIGSYMMVSPNNGSMRVKRVK